MGQYDWIVDILNQTTPQINPLALAATQGGMSRTTLGQLTDPSILFGTGVLTEDQLAAMLTQYLASSEEQLLGEAEKEYLKALEDWNNKQTALQLKYVVEEPKFYDDSYTSTLQRFGGDPVVQSVMDSLIGSGTQSPLTVGQAQRKMQSELDVNGWVRYGFDPETAQYFINNGVTSVDQYLRSPIGANMSPEMAEEFKNDTLKSVGGAASDFRTRYAEWERGNESRARQYQAELQILGERPSPEAVPFDVEAERLKFFKDIGLEGLALLPDPTVPYAISAADVYARQPESASRKALQQFIDTGSPEVELLTSRPVQIGDPKSGYAMAEAGAIGAKAPTVSGTDIGKDILARQQARRTDAGRAYTNVRGEQGIARVVADLLNKRLQEEGRTPFSDAMRQQYGYGGLV